MVHPWLIIRCLFHRVKTAGTYVRIPSCLLVAEDASKVITIHSQQQRAQQLYINVFGRTVSVDVETTVTVGELLSLLVDKDLLRSRAVGIVVKDGNRCLDVCRTLASYQLSTLSRITVTGRLLGGARPRKRSKVTGAWNLRACACVQGALHVFSVVFSVAQCMCSVFL